MRDTSSGYGWLSIALHWLTAAIVLVMLTVGSLTQPSRLGPADPRLLRIHTTVGISVYVLLWGRILWRFYVGHPGPLPKQGRFAFALGKYFHYVLLVAIAAMLLTGPLIAWSAGQALALFDVTLPSPWSGNPQLHEFARHIHGYAATFIFAGLLLHVAAVIKHTVMNRDGTFDKIMVADGGRGD